MNINYSKIIAEKNAHNYSSMATDSVITFTKRLDSLLVESSDVIKKYLPDISRNELGTGFVRYYSLTENMSGDDIGCLLENINDDNSCTEFLKTIKEYKDSNEYLKNETLYEFAARRYKTACLYEATYVDELDLIGYNINTSPETIDRYAKLLCKVASDDYNKVCASFPELLRKNTAIVLGMRVVVTGQTANLLISLPAIITKRLIKEGNAKQQREFAKMLDVSMKDARALLQTADSRHYNLHIAYLDNLDMAKTELTNHLANTVKESTLYENIASMQPDIVAYEEAVIEDPAAELEELLTNMIFDEDEEISEESMVRLARIGQHIDHMYYVDESKHLIRKAANKIERTNSKIASKMDAAKKERQITKTAVSKAMSPFATAMSKFLNDFKEKDTKERKERMITNEFSRKLMNYIKKGIHILVVGGAGAAGGLGGIVIAAIVIAVGIAVDKSTDAKVKRTILKDLETELAVVNEKLEDSRSDSDKKNKYELIRIKKKLEREIERVKYKIGPDMREK